MAYSGTIDEQAVDVNYMNRLSEKKAEARREQVEGEENNRTNYQNMDEVNGGRRGMKEKAVGAVKDKIEKKVEKVVMKKILSGTPFVSAFYGAFAFFWNISTADKKKKIDFNMWDWLLIVISNIEMIGFMLGGLAIIVIMADFVSADAGWIETTLKVVGGITKYGWDGMKALYTLFHS